MDEELKGKILRLLEENRVMTLATLRPDGWPQATTVGFAHDGLSLYFLCGRDSQKAANLTLDDRVSLTIDKDSPQVMAITGLSMAGRARRITDPTEANAILPSIMARYPEQAAMNLPMPAISDVALFKVEPMVISVLDYALGFGHTDLVTL